VAGAVDVLAVLPLSAPIGVLLQILQSLLQGASERSALLSEEFLSTCVDLVALVRSHPMTAWRSFEAPADVIAAHCRLMAAAASTSSWDQKRCVHTNVDRYLSPILIDASLQGYVSEAHGGRSSRSCSGYSDRSQKLGFQCLF
jgi:hypothetical protein